MENLIGKKFICKSNQQRYQIVKIIKYKDENSKLSNKETNGWIAAVIYIPLYPCEITEFARSLTMFISEFDLDPQHD